MKRAQVETQTLMYALSAIIAVFLLIFGYSAIGKFQDDGSNAEQLVFENSLKKRFNSVDYGTMFPVDLFLPQKYTGICFVHSVMNDATLLPNPINPDTDPISAQCRDDPVITASMRVGSLNDVFLIEGSKRIATAAYQLSNLSVRVDTDADGTLESCFCVPKKGGKVSFFLEGFGRTIGVRPVNE